MFISSTFCRVQKFSAVEQDEKCIDAVQEAVGLNREIREKIIARNFVNGSNIKSSFAGIDRDIGAEKRCSDRYSEYCPRKRGKEDVG